MRVPPRLRSLLGAALLLGSAVPAFAQATDSRVVPRARMQAFLRSIEGGDLEKIVAFFPQHGEWTWVQTWYDEHHHTLPGPGVWKFPASITRRMLDRGGPVCDSFDLY